MESKFALNKMMFVEMDRMNILMDRRQTATESNQINSHFLSYFLSSTRKTKGSVSKCLFGRPEERATKQLEQKMLQQERIRALNLYQFDISSGQPVNLTPPASPHIGNRSSFSNNRVGLPVSQKKVECLVKEEESAKDQEQTVISTEIGRSEPESDRSMWNSRSSLKRRSSDGDDDELESGSPSSAVSHDLKRQRME